MARSCEGHRSADYLASISGRLDESWNIRPISYVKTGTWSLIKTLEQSQDADK